MELLLFSPDGGGMPQLENVPTLLQVPLTKLQKLSCVAGVTSGSLQDNITAVVRIDFSNRRKSNCKKALRCFSAAGLVPAHLLSNPLGQFMQIWFKPSKTLTT